MPEKITLLKKKKVETIAEKTTPTVLAKPKVPVQKSKQQKRKFPPSIPNMLRKDVFKSGDLIIVTNRSGVMFLGKFEVFVQGSYYLSNVEITSKVHKIKTAWVLVDMSTVSHVHPAEIELAIIKDIL